MFTFFDARRNGHKSKTYDISVELDCAKIPN